MERKKSTNKSQSLPTGTQPCSVLITEAAGEQRITEDPLKDSVFTPRVDERGWLGKFSDGGLESKEPKNPRPPDSALTGGNAHADEPPPQQEENGEKEQTKPEHKDGDLKAPVELMMKFLKALVDKEFELASRLCQMILIYEPHNPEASQFLPLIRRKLLEESEQSDEEDGERDDDSGSDEKPSSASDSSSSCSSSSSDDNDEEDED